MAAEAAHALTAKPLEPDRDALRAEHDRLAARLAARTSILEVRRASIAMFVGFLGVGFTGKLGWDRWGIVKAGDVPPAPQAGPAVLVWGSMLLACVAFALAIRWYLKARPLLAAEDAEFARFREVRAALGIDT